MDTNNRQNWSTQNFEAQDASHYSRDNRRYTSRREQQATMPDGASRGKHAQRESLDQNVAFGTEKKPEGFVQTWKSSSHAWRWRAVLCLFLSLLLMLMQPSGNALYRSWNASSGEMMGLAAAAGEGGEEGQDEYVLADIEDTPMTALQDGDEGGTITYPDHVTENGTVYYIADHTATNVPALIWTPALINSQGAKTTSGRAYNYINPDTFFNDTNYATYSLDDDRTSSDRTKRADPTKAQMGAITWVGPLETTQTQTWSATTNPGYWAWALGYELDYWRGVKPDQMWAPLLAGYSGVTYSSEEDLISVSEIHNFQDHQPHVASGDSYSANIHDGYTLGDTDSGIDPSAPSGGKYDYYLFAIWNKREGSGGYKVSILGADGNNALFQSASGVSSDTAGPYAWDDKVSIADLLSQTDLPPRLQTYMLNNCTWAVGTVGTITVEDDEGGATTLEAAGESLYMLPQSALSSNDTILGDLVNPSGEETDPGIDPYSLSSPYGKAGTNYLGRINVSPSFSITYVGGTQGNTQEQLYPTNFSYQEADAEAGTPEDFFVYSHLPEEDLTVLNGDDIKKTGSTATFIGWHASEPTAGLTSETVDIPASSVTQDGGLSIFEALKGLDSTTSDPSSGEEGEWIKVYDSQGNRLVDSYGNIFQNITLYAVWEGGSSTHPVTFKLADGYTGEVKLDTSATPEGGYTLAGGDPYKSLTAPTLLDADPTKPVVGTKYESNQYTWSVVEGTESKSENGSASEENDDAITITLTPVRKTYDVTINAVTASGNFGKQANNSANPVTKIKVVGVPYETAYADIAYDPTTAVLTDNDATLTVAYKSGGTALQGRMNQGAGKGKWFKTTVSDVETYVDTTDSWNPATTPWPGTLAVVTENADASSVKEDTVLKYTYDEGYYKLSYALASKPQGATGPSNQTTADVELSSTDSTYVLVSNWTKANIVTNNPPSAPTLVQKEGTDAAKYTGGLDWSTSETTGTAFDASKDYTVVAEPILKDYTVSLTVGNSTKPDNRGKVTVDSGGHAITSPQYATATQVGTVLWGNKASDAINAAVIGGIWLSDDDQNVSVDKTHVLTWTYEGDASPTNMYTWDGTNPESASTVVTQNASYVLLPGKHPYDLTVTTDGGWLNASSTPAADASNRAYTNFTIKDVPYGTSLSGVTYDVNNGVYTYNRSDTGTALNGALTPDTARGRNATGVWDPENLGGTMPASAKTVTYTFGKDPVTVNFTIVGADGETTGPGKWDDRSTTNSPVYTITGILDYGDTLDKLKINSVKVENLNFLAASNVALTTATTDGIAKATEIAYAAQYKTSDGTWIATDTYSGSTSTTPGTTTVVDPKAKTDSSWVQTYKYKLANRNDYEITYRIPDDYATEVVFTDNSAATKTAQSLTYGAAISDTKPTTIKSNEYADFDKKYASTSVLGWAPELASDATVGYWNAVVPTDPSTWVDNPSKTYVAVLDLKPYTVSYVVEGGTWTSNSSATYANNEEVLRYKDNPDQATLTSDPTKAIAQLGTAINTTKTPALAGTGATVSGTDKGVVTPASGYSKTNDAWVGKWTMSTDGTNFTDLPANATRPSDVQLTSQTTTFKLTLVPVVEATWKADNDGDNRSITNTFTWDDTKTQFFVGEDMSSEVPNPGSVDSPGDDPNNKSTYQKSQGASPRKSGHWASSDETNYPFPTAEIKPAPAADTTYTYTIYKVYTATYSVQHGTWNGVSDDESTQIDERTAPRTQEVFANEPLVFPGSTRTKAVYNAVADWYTGTAVVGANKLSSTEDITISENMQYLANHAPTNTGDLEYTVRFHIQSTALEDYPYSTTHDVKVTGITAGDEANLTWNSAVITENGPQTFESNASTVTLTSAGFEAKTEDNPNFNTYATTIIEDTNQVFDVYYARRSFKVTYQYGYDTDGTSLSDDEKTAIAEVAFKDAPALPNNGAAISKPYNSTLAPDTESDASAYGTATDFLSFSGWARTDNVGLTGYVPATNITLKGTWTREPATVRLKNNDTSSTGGTISAGAQTNTINLTGLKYGDRITWPEVTITPSTSGPGTIFFGGWEYPTGTNIGSDLDKQLPRVTAMTMEVLATWSSGIRVQYLPDGEGANAKANFEKQDSGYKQPDPGTNYIEVPAFSSDKLDTKATNAPNEGKPKAKPGYVFKHWAWGSEKSDSPTQPVNGTTTTSLTFTAVFEGTKHGITYDVNGGAQKPNLTNALIPGTENDSRKTGDPIYLPKADELTRTGVTLSGYTVKMAGVQVDGDEHQEGKQPFAPGTTWYVPAGTSADYTDIIEITANWTVKVEFATSAPTLAGLASTGIPAAIQAANAANTAVALGGNVNIPTVNIAGENETADIRTIANVPVNTGYHFTGYTVNKGLDPALTPIPLSATGLVAGSTGFTIPSASDAVFPASGIEVTANWAIDTYTVKWTYPNDEKYSDAELTAPSSSTVEYNTAGATVQTNTAPTLQDKGSAAFAARYTADSTGIDWYLVDGSTTTKVKMNDSNFTFGVDFWYDDEGNIYSSDPGSGHEFKWDNGDEVTFLGVPIIKKYTVTIQVTNGTMTDPKTHANNQTSVSYDVEHDAPFLTDNGVEGFLPNTGASDYEFLSGDTGDNIKYDPNAGHWSSTPGDPFSTSPSIRRVTGNATYTYVFDVLKTYKPTFTLEGADVEGEVQLDPNFKPSPHEKPQYGDHYSFPSLVDVSVANSGFSDKYETTLTWRLKTERLNDQEQHIITYTDVTTADSYTDASADGKTSGSYAKAVQFVGTPVTKKYTINVKVSGGKFNDDQSESKTRKETDQALYNHKLSEYLPNVADGTMGFTSNNTPRVTSGHWEDSNGNVVTGDTTVTGSETYTYVFDTQRTVTMNVVHNTFVNGGDNVTQKVYYVADNLKDDADAKLSSAVDSTGAAAFTSENTLADAYQLRTITADYGYRWNDTGWAVSPSAAAYLVDDNKQADGSPLTEARKFPNPDASIVDDVTYTYTMTAKPVHVKFIQMFQKSDGTVPNVDGTYKDKTTSAAEFEMLDAEGNATTDKSQARYVMWEGTYDEAAAALSTFADRKFNASLKGYVIEPVNPNNLLEATKATTDAAGTDVVDTIPQTDIKATDSEGLTTYYLWYKRIPITINHSYTNTADAPTNSEATLPGRAMTIYGHTPEYPMANPTDSSFRLALDGWYLKDESPLANVPSAVVVKPGATYAFTPDYTGNPDGLPMSFYGTWSEASYAVTYALEPYDENLAATPQVVNDKRAKFTLNGVTGAEGASATTPAIAYGTALGTNVPTAVTFSDVVSDDPNEAVVGADKYEIKGWKLYVVEDGTASDVTGTLTVANDGVVATDGLLATDDLKNLKVMRSNYELRPQFALQTKTVYLSGGKYGDVGEVVYTVKDQKANATKWVVPWGTEVSLPSFDQSTSAWLNENNFVRPHDEDKYAVVGTSQANAPAAWVKVSDDPIKRTQWPNTTGHKLKVVEDAEYEYQWTELSYEISYNNVGSASNIKNLAGVTTTSTVHWGDSVFAGNVPGKSTSVIDTYGKYTGLNPDDPRYEKDIITYPTWPGHTFLGWRVAKNVGTDAAPDIKPTGSIITPAGYDMTVSAAYNPAASNYGTKIYLWAEWEGMDTTVTFYKNDKDIGTDNEVTATQSMRVAEAASLTKVSELESENGATFDRTGYTFKEWRTERADVSPYTLSGDTYKNGVEYEPAYDAEHDQDLPHNLYADWTPNTYVVQYAHFDGSLFTSAEVTNDDNDDTKDKPYQQTFTYDNAATERLTTAITAAMVNSNEGGKNPDDAAFAGWKYNSTTYQPDDPVHNLTSEADGVVVLTPASTGKVRLTYDANGQGDVVTDAPTGENITVLANKSETVNGTKGYAKFTMPSATPKRAGYSFAGWKIPNAADASGAPITAAYAGATVYLPGSVSSYTAVAQWEVSTSAKYYIERLVQTTPNGTTYEPYNGEARVEKTDGVTGQVKTITEAEVAASYAIPGYTFMPGLSTMSITISGDESKNVITLKYNLKTVDVTYRFMDATTNTWKALTGKAAGATPFGSGSVETLLGNSLHKLKVFESVNLPTGYKIKSGYTAKWWYDAVDASLLTSAGAVVATGALEADNTTEYKVIGDTTFTLPLEKEQYTVTFHLGDNVAWKDGTAAARDKTTQIYYEESVNLVSAGAEIVEAGADSSKKYGFGGWVYNNTSNASDPLNGKSFSNLSGIEIVGNTTFTASYFIAHTVTWSPGDHAKHGFNNTDAALLKFSNRPTTYSWTTTADDPKADEAFAGLLLADADIDTNGVPLAADGYSFAGWKVTCASGIKEVDGATEVNGTVYASLDDLYARVSPTEDYIIEAQWDTITQTVVFNPNISGGADSEMAETITMTGKTGTGKTLTPVEGADAKAPEAPDARAGFTFQYWQNVDDNTIQLGEEEAFLFPAKAYPATTNYLAIWKADTIDILTAVEGLGTIKANKSTTNIVANQPDTYTLKANPMPGYKFTKWTVTPKGSTTASDVDESWYDKTIADKSNGAYGLLTIGQNSQGLYEAATYTAHFSADPYQVSFANSDGSKGTLMVTYAKIDDKDVMYEEVNYLGNVKTTSFKAEGIDTAGNPTGYEFASWSYVMEQETQAADGSLTTTTVTGTGLTDADVKALPIKGDTVFTAQYTEKEASVTFDKNAPEGAEITGSVGDVEGKKTGDEITLPSGYSWVGHKLLGWVTAKPGKATMTKAELAADPTLAGFVDGADGPNTYTLKGGKETLYAIYEAIPVTLVYDNNAQAAAISANPKLAEHGAKDITVNAGEGTTALTVAQVNWSESPLVTQPGYVTEDAVPLKIPGAAREFAGWSFDPAADPNDEAHSAKIFKPGDIIKASFLPTGATGDTSRTIYAIWKNKKFNVTLDQNGGWLANGATEPASPLATNVQYGDIVSVPANPYTRGNDYYFKYWQANDSDTQPSRVGSATGAAASYTFKGTSDVVLQAQWQARASAKPIAVVQLYDEADKPLKATPLEGYVEGDKPLLSGAYENQTSAGNGATKDTSTYFQFLGWYISNARSAAQQVAGGVAGDAPWRDVNVAGLLQMYDGTRVQSPQYWNGTDYILDNTYSNNLISLYAKKKLVKYDILFDANIPSGSGYEATDAGTLSPMTGLLVNNETTRLTTAPNALDGYRFLGWQIGGSATHATTTNSVFDPLVVNKTGVAATSLADPGYSLNPALLAETDTTYQVTLYAAWADTASTVTFVQAYEGDGVRTAGGKTVLEDYTKQGLKWKQKLGAAAADVPDLSTAHHPDDLENPATTAFVGWETQNGVVVWSADSTTRLEDLTVADIVKLDDQLAPDVNGAYSIELRAVWSRTAARVIYNNDDGDATGTVPAGVAVPINETGAESEYALSVNPLQKIGYHADGWVGKDNEGAYNGTVGAYNAVFDTQHSIDPYYDATTRKMKFDKDAAGMVVNLYPNFVANAYTVSYGYEKPDPDYTSVVTPDPVPGKKGGSAVESVSGLGWSTGSVYASDLFDADTPPVLEGYELTGWTYTTTSKHEKLEVQKGWSVEQLVAAIEAVDPNDTNVNVWKYEGGTIPLTAKWTAKSYTVAYDADGGVVIATGASPSAKTGLKWTDTVDSANERLLIEKSKMRKDGNTGPTWYVDEGKAYSAHDGARGDQPTIEDLVGLYHKAKGDAADATKALSGTLTLYAGWTENLKTITFTVSDGENGWITEIEQDGISTSYGDNQKTEVSYLVGAVSGKVHKIDGVAVDDDSTLTIQQVKVTVKTTAGYSVPSWIFEDVDTVTTDSKSYQLTGFNGTGEFVGGTYEAQILGQPDVKMKLVYHDQQPNGSYATQEVTQIDDEDITASDFLNVEGAQAKVGDVIPAANLGAVRTNVPAGLKLRTSDLADFTVKANDANNVVHLYYDLAQVDVKFAWQWPEGAECATPPATPPTRVDQLYGSTQAVPADAAADGYVFDGWYLNGSKLTGENFTLESTDDITVYGVFKRAEYPVTLKGVYDEDGNHVATPADISVSTDVQWQVAKGETLGNAHKIVVKDTLGKVEEIVLGKQTGTVDYSVTYSSDEHDIVWMYKVDGTWHTTSDPTKVVINQATDFLVVASGAQMISYLTGDHGAFGTTKAAGARVENVPADYNMADYLFTSVNELKVAAGQLETNSDSENYNMPKGEPGWRFNGWKWEYAGANGYMREGATPEDVLKADSIVPERMMNAGVEDLTGLVHGIQLTAQWVPTQSYLKFDLNDRGRVENAQNELVYAQWKAGDPSGLKPTYDGTNAVTLPKADDVQRDGFTLSKWQWTTKDSQGHAVTYEYEPGASFQMPSSDKTSANDPAVTLTAKWTEDYVTIAYVSNDNAKGTVSASEKVGAWSGVKVNTASTPVAGSIAKAADHFHYVKWTTGSFNGPEVSNGINASTHALTPLRNDAGRYVDITYYATFEGDSVEVTFIVTEGQESMGKITVGGFEKAEDETLQNVPYGDAPSMATKGAEVVAVPATGYTIGSYWNIYVLNSSNNWVKKGTTTDPGTVKVTSKTRFAATFKENTGSYVVHFAPGEGSSSVFDDIEKGWGDTNVGAGKTPVRPGYTFNGWWVDPRGQSPATVAGKGGQAKYDAEPGLLPAVSNTYGKLAGGDAYEPQAAQDGITLKAGWIEKGGFAVTFSGNGGTFPTTPESTTQTVSNLKWTSAVDTTVLKPSRPGYTFTGWSTKPSDGAILPAGVTYDTLAGTNDTAPGSITLYAQWEETLYKVKFVNTLTGDDPISADGSNALKFDNVKYADVIAKIGGTPYNAKEDDRVWKCWAVGTSNATSPNQELTSDEGAADWTIANFEEKNVYMDSDGYYVVFAKWIEKIPYTTTFILYDGAPEADEDVRTGMDSPSSFKNPKILERLTVTDKGLPDEWVTPNWEKAQSLPGFKLDEALTLRYNNEMMTPSPGYASTDDIKVQLVENMQMHNFDVALVAKQGYSLAFDLNDENISFPSGVLLKAATPEGTDGSSYPTQVVKDFFKDRNVPWSVYSEDNSDSGYAFADPTRPGFMFDGWYNLVVKDTEELTENDIKSDEGILYGELAFNAAGEWYDPMDPPTYGELTLHARWIEMQRIVHYIVAEDMKNLVKIRLQSEADSAYSTAERSEVIGAATGDVFEDGVRKAHDEVPQGAIAKVNRGYTVVWRILLADAAAQAKSYSMPLGAYGDNATTMSASSIVSDMSAMAAAAIDEATSVEAEASAEGALMSAMGTVGGSDKATSSQGKTYSATAAITPGVAADTGLFAGEATSADDTDASKVLYVATASQNASKNITFNPSGADKYSGPSKLSQPYGTFIGETPENGVWGVSDGSLPDRNQIRRVGHTFNGWKSSTALTYESEDGSIQEIPANTVIVPGSWIANHLIVPESGVTLTADWKEGAPTWAIVIPDSTNPNTGEVVPGTTIEIKDGETPTNDQISEILNRGGSYPDKWSVTYYDIDGKQHSETMTTDQLIAFLQKNPVVSDMTIAPAQGAKWGTTAPTIPDNGSGSATKGTSASGKSAKTGDSLFAMVPTLAGIAFMAAAVVFLLLSLRRRKD